VQDVRQLGAQHVTLHIKSMVGDVLPGLVYGADLHAAQCPVNRRVLSQQASRSMVAALPPIIHRQEALRSIVAHHGSAHATATRSAG
jgi:hypothetical protein